MVTIQISSRGKNFKFELNLCFVIHYEGLIIILNIICNYSK